jgi:type III pantothenate kinase
MLNAKGPCHSKFNICNLKFLKVLLAIDIGNSDVVLGLANGEAWPHIWRTTTLPDQPALAYELKVRQYFLEAGVSLSRVEEVVLSSVVPPLTDKLVEVAVKLFGKPPLVVGPEVYPLLDVQIDRPHEIGSDLVANAVAAHTRYRKNCVVVDFGTALTFTTVLAHGHLLGVAIAPGLRTAIRALSQNTARLPDVPLEMPASAIGKNTIHAMQAGVLLGYAGLVESLITHIRTELDDPGCIAVATGGLSSILTPLKHVFHAIEPTLTLDGLRIISRFARGR